MAEIPIKFTGVAGTEKARLHFTEKDECGDQL
jgi:hypothetical protein